MSTCICEGLHEEGTFPADDRCAKFQEPFICVKHHMIKNIIKHVNHKKEIQSLFDIHTQSFSGSCNILKLAGRASTHTY